MSIPAPTFSIYPATANQETRSATQARTKGHKPNEFFALRLCGEVDAGAIERALHGVVARHEALRTDFPAQQGRRVQRAWSEVMVPFRAIDLRHATETRRAQVLADHCARETADPFDIECAPLLRGILFRIGEREYVIAIFCDHLIIDGWSINVFWHDFLHLYRSHRLDEPASLPPVRKQFGEFVAWHRARLSETRLANLRAFWQARLSSPPALIEWNHVSARPDPFTYLSAVTRWSVEGEQFQAMKRVAAATGSSLFAVFNALYLRLLRRLGAKQEILMHTPSANRRSAEFHNTIGCFANGVLLRLELPESASLEQEIAANAQVVREAYAYGEFPLTMTREFVGSRPNSSFGFRTQVSHLHYSFYRLPQIEIPGLDVAPSMVSMDEVFTYWAYDMGLCSWVLRDSAAFALWHNTALFERAVVEDAIAHLREEITRLSS